MVRRSLRQEGAGDLIPTNRWLQRVVLPGMVEFMRMPLGAGRRPRTGNEEGAREPIRFYMQIADQEDIAMLIIPPKFRSVMRQCIVLAPPHVISLSANKWCEFWFQVQMFKDHMVLGRGWEYFCDRHRIVPSDLLVFKLSGLGIMVQI
ncbi:Protein transport protein Sec31A [Hordeum vulgare]|nr:Protein transport protein Sec31A [Hordeum vulgare]